MPAERERRPSPPRPAPYESRLHTASSTRPGTTALDSDDGASDRTIRAHLGFRFLPLY